MSLPLGTRLCCFIVLLVLLNVVVGRHIRHRLTHAEQGPVFDAQRCHRDLVDGRHVIEVLAEVVVVVPLELPNCPMSRPCWR